MQKLLKILFTTFCLVFSIIVKAASTDCSDDFRSLERISIDSIDFSRDERELREINEAHLRSPAKDLRGDFEHFIDNYQSSIILKKLGIHPVFGLHGFYYRTPGESIPKIIGYIDVDYFKKGFMAPHYAECRMLLHPEYRGRGLGTAFRRLFLTQLVDPLIGKKIIAGEWDKDLGIPLRVENIFLGVKSFVDVDNLASRKVLVKSGYSVYDLFCDPSETEVKAQIVYIYPPKESLLSLELVEIIKECNISHKPLITENAIRRQISHAKFELLYDKAYEIWERGGERRVFEVYKGLKKIARNTESPFSEEYFWAFIKLQLLTAEDKLCLKKTIQENALDFSHGLTS